MRKMKTLSAELRRRLLGLSGEDVRYARRGFRGATDEMRARLEQIGAAFLDGYHAALEHPATNALGFALERVNCELRGFAFEGAAMGLALQDCLTPWRTDRLSRFLRGAGEPHTYMAHVGAGWVWARWPLGRAGSRRRLDPLLQWLGFDGWGFHEGFFHWPKYLSGHSWPRALQGYEKRAFDQGLGRSWWFVNGGNPELIANTIAGFAVERQADLWSGIGLAATYAGIVAQTTLESVRESAGPLWPHVAQGSAFAAKARQRAGNLSQYTDLATQTLCRLSAVEAARLCDTTLAEIMAQGHTTTEPQGHGTLAWRTPQTTPTPALPRYELWRQRIQSELENSRAPDSELQVASMVG